MRKIIVLFITILTAGCGGSKHTDPKPEDLVPVAAVLSLPAQNELCTSGSVMSATQSAVKFTWNAAHNAESYELVITDLVSQVATNTSTPATSATVTLKRGTPYSWIVISKTSKVTTTVKGNTWKFYNAGTGAVTYAPFPAEAVSPSQGELLSTGTVSIDLSWLGAAIDLSTIASYDVYFGTTPTPPVLKTGITDSFLKGQNVFPGQTYYWRVISRDKTGATSLSQLFQFTVI